MSLFDNVLRHTEEVSVDTSSCRDISVSLWEKLNEFHPGCFNAPKALFDNDGAHYCDTIQLAKGKISSFKGMKRLGLHAEVLELLKVVQGEGLTTDCIFQSVIKENNGISKRIEILKIFIGASEQEVYDETQKASTTTSAPAPSEEERPLM